ncbi:Arm DNA-binding domain-containing protein [Hyphomicrobium sp. 99]|uniref:Arm DNA-binding domain-containing protein n=1 Tax=Hyphomicrobium sp. 99 TaxID=1163419 RepID=UPI0012E07AF2|nr:Arm DNA-binding domain-containing protein [Hyphomicrobium sp. 99]
MAKSTHRLNAIKAANVKAVGMHPDGAGLYLKVDKGGSKSWVFRYCSIGGSAILVWAR